MVHKQPSKAPLDAGLCTPSDAASVNGATLPVDVGEAVTPLQRAILAAIGHAAAEDAAPRSDGGHVSSFNGDATSTEATAYTSLPCSQSQRSKQSAHQQQPAATQKQPTCAPSSYNAAVVTLAANSKVLSPEHLETELNKKLKRQGFVRAEEVLAFFEALKNRGHCSGRQAKFLIGSFGSRMSLDRAGKKMNALEEIWKTLPFLGVVYTVEHYNAALRVLIENEESFSPIQVLLEMESQGKKKPASSVLNDASASALPPRCASAGGVRRKSGGDGSDGEFRVEPDRNTFELFIALFCQEGRVEAVGPILNHMQSKNLLVGENILNSLVYGHVKVGDEATTRRILGLMGQSGIPTTVSTVEAILCGFAESGDILKMSMIIREVRRKGVERKDVDLKDILGGSAGEKISDLAGADSFDDGSGVIIASSPTALTPPNVMPSFDFEVHSMPLIDNQALLSSILALVKCGHGEHLKVIANHIVVDPDTPVVFLHQFRNALFHLLIEGYKRESFALLGHFALKTVGIEKKVNDSEERSADADAGGTSSSSAPVSNPVVEAPKSHPKPSANSKPDFYQVRDDLIRTFFKAVLDQKLSLEEFLQLFSTHLFEVDANIATLILRNNIDLISKCYSESELVFLS